MFSVAIELGGTAELKHYRPLPVSPNLRGFAEDDSQVRANISSGRVVSITGLAARFCPTGRDIYLEKRLRVDTPSWERSVVGKVVDSVLVDLHRIGMERMEEDFETALRIHGGVNLERLQKRILAAGENVVRKYLLQEWTYPGRDNPSLRDATIESFAERVTGSTAAASERIEKTFDAILDLVRYETRLLIEFLRRRRRAHFWSRPFTGPEGWMAEGRAALARLQTGVNLEASEARARAFGVSPNVCPDFLYAVTLIGDIKTGGHEFHKSVATGYAILAEFALQRRINTAYILAVDLDVASGRLRSHRVIRVATDDRLRRLWITQRDFALEVMRADAAPRHPTAIEACEPCPYRQECWEGGVPGTKPRTPEPPARSPKPAKGSG